MTQPDGRSAETHDSETTYEVCIVGAGIVGMNALVVATSYLPSSAKVLLVDSRPRVGGMWVDTYDYVRLHQPHAIFTAGNIKWDLQVAPSHLATKPEVLDHFQRCLDIAKQQVDVEERFGWTLESHQESDDLVHVTLRSPSGEQRQVRAKRLVKAFGHQVPPAEPLQVSSPQVHSTTPELLDIDEPAFRSSEAPIWIIGSGKTATDTAHLLITAFPDREVSMVSGAGTMFARRETFFPVGARRWWSGTPINTMSRQVGRRFDGTNEDEVREWFRARYGVSPIEDSKDYFSAYLSEAESRVIKGGLRTVEPEYLVDAVDRDDQVELVFRSGRTRPIAPGSWLINCTGSLLRDSRPYEPFVSASGSTLSIQMRSAATGVFAPFAGYYLTHLMFRDRLTDLGLYELDVEALYRKNKPVVVFASFSLILHNLSLVSEVLPSRVLMDCGLDYDLWYPLPRRIAGTLAFLRTHRRDREHHRRTLDTIAQRFDVTCRPVNVMSHHA